MMADCVQGCKSADMQAFPRAAAIQSRRDDMHPTAQTHVVPLEQKRHSSRVLKILVNTIFYDSTGFYVRSEKPNLQREFRPNGPVRCQPGASPQDGNTSE
ncbi:MAG: hypothetical protein DWI29_03660 [Planctomycetota bacterium]|nr:MAG: hypothetical protein DWI29_03660 [Planctomycetota bacterium]